MFTLESESYNLFRLLCKPTVNIYSIENSIDLMKQFKIFNVSLKPLQLKFPPIIVTDLDFSNVFKKYISCIYLT